MAWDGWFLFDGSEIINVQRTEQYAKNLRLPWFKPAFETDSLGYMLGDGLTYRTPLLDSAPWMDEDVDYSSDFLGLYPLNIAGLENSSRQASIFESTKNGGVVRGVRHGTKTFVFSGILIGLSEEAVEYGHRWLKQVLNGNPCEGTVCNGADLCFAASEPMMELPHPLDGATLVEEEGLYGGPPEYGEGLYGGEGFTIVMPQAVPTFNPAPCFAPYMRQYRNVTITLGPDVTGKYELSDGSHCWAVSFTATAGNPYEYAGEIPVISQFMAPETVVPWAPGIVPGTFDAEGAVYDEVPCLEPLLAPVYDPLCPALVPPPLPADVPLGCYTPPVNWHRRFITIPKENIPLWGDMVPIIQVHARDADVRAMRVRFYADPFDEGDLNSDPCSYCGDLVFSFVPKGSTMYFDGTQERVLITGPNSQRGADSLVFGTNGRPFEWPVLSCGFGYVVTFDMTQTQPPPVIDLTLVPRVI